MFSKNVFTCFCLSYIIINLPLDGVKCFVRCQDSLKQVEIKKLKINTEVKDLQGGKGSFCLKIKIIYTLSNM